MGYDKTKLLSNIRVISLAIKNIEKGFCKSNPVNYIMDVYEMDMRTSVDVCKLDHDIIDIVLDHVNNNTSDDEEALILFLQENKITKPIINYILDRNDDISDENCEYTVKIVYDDSLQFYNYKNINYYTICNKMVNLKNDSKLTFPKSNNEFECKSLNFYEYYHKNDKLVCKNRICINLSDDNIFYRNNKCEKCGIPSFANIIDPILKIWFPTEYYSVDNKYLTFYSKTFVGKLLSTRMHKNSNGTIYNNNSYNWKLDTNLKNDNDIIKIPLIDGLRMKTPIGYASVKKTKTIDEYLSVCKWTDHDFDNYSK